MKMTPLQAIRKYCLYCMNGQENEVRLCTSEQCALFNCRMQENNTDPRVSALQLIKKYCTDCSDGKAKERINCTFYGCQLYLYRNGKNSNYHLSEDEKKRRGELCKRARACKKDSGRQ